MLNSTTVISNISICNCNSALYIGIAKHLCAVLLVVKNLQMFITKHFFIPCFWRFPRIKQKSGNRTASVALIQNARSNKTASGRKDIIKVEGDASWLNLDVLAYLDPGISVTIIENGKAVRKEKPMPPKRLVNIVKCRNPRCISSIEEECDQIFELSSNGKYRCIYCEQELQVKPE